jgi:hypothetical protein
MNKKADRDRLEGAGKGSLIGGLAGNIAGAGIGAMALPLFARKFGGRKKLLEHIISKGSAVRSLPLKFDAMIMKNNISDEKIRKAYKLIQLKHALTGGTFGGDRKSVV